MSYQRMLAVALIFAVLVCGGFLLVAEIVFDVRLVRPAIRGFHVSGKVIDARTGRTAPHAHVIVVAWTAQVKSASRCYGFIADSNGNFDIQYETPYSLRRMLSVKAASPDGGYGELGLDKRLKIKGQTLTAFNVKLEVQAPSERQKEMARYQYETFCPGCPPDQNLEFLDEGWDARFHD